MTLGALAHPIAAMSVGCTRLQLERGWLDTAFAHDKKRGGQKMQKFLYGLAGLALALAGADSANAQDTIKIGVIMPYSGQFADTAAQMDNAIKLYMKPVSYTHLYRNLHQVLLPLLPLGEGTAFAQGRQLP